MNLFSRPLMATSFAALALVFSGCSHIKQAKTDEWRPLWDGKTADGWRGAGKEQFPTNRWEMKDGVLTVVGNQGKPGGGDTITKQTYACFELTAEFKITPGANSGIKYFVQADSDPAAPGIKRTPASVGFEYQILDDVLHPDAKLGTNGNRTIGSLYDVVPAAKDKTVNPIGEWNTMRIVANGDHIEHWLNGKKILEFSRSSDDFKKHITESKFKDMPGFGKWTEGHILLQDHGDSVSFRNVKIRALP